MHVEETNAMTTAQLPLLYVLHSGELYGTERMAIATLAALGESADRLLLAPPGPAVEHARSLDVPARSFSSRVELFRQMDRFLRAHRQVALIATGIGQSLMGIAIARLRGVRLRHLHAVHGGADDRLSYGRKKWLLPFAVEYVAVSRFVRNKLMAHGVPGARIRVVGNFLTQGVATRADTATDPIRRVIVVSRLDPIKRVGLLLDALAMLPDRESLSVQVYGRGWEETALRERAARHHPNVKFAGITQDIGAALRDADLLVHTCPEEPFGLVVLEAMAAGVPVLVPNRGGPSEFIIHGVNGFVYCAGDAAALARALSELRCLAPQRIQNIVWTAMTTVSERYSAAARIDDYRTLIAAQPKWA